MENRFDVIVLGGAIAGAAAALLLRRRLPHLRVLIVEKNTAFDWKVGESTVEASSYFLNRVLKMYDHLSQEQLAKQGFRYFFHNGKASCIYEASEVGPYHLARTPGFQLDRSKLDEHVLATAVSEGAELWRPAKVMEVHLAEETGEKDNLVRVERDGKVHDLRTPWVVDATGRAAIISRKRGWLKPIADHPTSSVWARYRNVKDLDGVAVGGISPDSCYSRGTIASRRLATNHFNGYGYWMWFIPLQGGETSVGVVWDRRIVEPIGTTPKEKLDWFLQGNPLTREMMEGSRIEENDLRQYANLPYLIDRACGKSFSLVGDAAGFLDPFYSPGLDQMAFSVSWTLELITQKFQEPNPQKFERLVNFHNEAYPRFFRFFYESIYKDKYYLMGDYDTMTASFLIDTAIYYFTLAWALYKGVGSRALLRPPYYPRHSDWAFYLIRGYQRRLISIARRKWELGIYGNHNHGRRPRLTGYDMGQLTIRMFCKGLWFWGKAEVANLWTYIWPPSARKKIAPPGPYNPPTTPSKIDDIDIPVPFTRRAAKLEAVATMSPAPANGVHKGTSSHGENGSSPVPPAMSEPATRIETDKANCGMPFGPKIEAAPAEPPAPMKSSSPMKAATKRMSPTKSGG